MGKGACTVQDPVLFPVQSLVFRALLKAFCVCTEFLYHCAANSQGWALPLLILFSRGCFILCRHLYIITFFYAFLPSKKKIKLLQLFIFLTPGMWSILLDLSLCHADFSRLRHSIFNWRVMAQPSANRSTQDFIDFVRCCFILYFSPTTCSLPDKVNIYGRYLEKKKKPWVTRRVFYDSVISLNLLDSISLLCRSSCLIIRLELKWYHDSVHLMFQVLWLKCFLVDGSAE